MWAYQPHLKILIAYKNIPIKEKGQKVYYMYLEMLDESAKFCKEQENLMRS